jgi:hypothetical protein
MMNAKAKLLAPDDIVVEISVTQTVREWRRIVTALHTGIQGNWSNTVDEFLDEIRDVVAAVDGVIQPEKKESV